MNTPHSIRDEVIARLITRHGLTGEEAAAMWEEYLLHLTAKRICLEPAGPHIEFN